MIEVNYEWKRLANDGTLKDIAELTADDKNWFDSRDEAIEWLKKKNEAHPDFADEDCLILKEMFFTRN